MKRILAGLLCACILLSGCHVSSEPTEPTQPPVTEAPTIQQGVYLLDQGRTLEGYSNLVYIPNEIVDRMERPEMRLLGNGLLLIEYRDGSLILNHISLEDGGLIASASIPAGEETRLSIGSGEIALCDQESGLITVLDEKFQIQRTYPVTGAGDDWYLNQELDTLYVFHFDRGLMVMDLETGDENWLVDNGYQVKCIGGGNSNLLIQYTDREDQKTYTRCLNLSTATLETLPIGGAVLDGIRQGELWLLQREDDHVLVDGETARSFIWDGTDAQLLSPRRHLLTMDFSRRELSLYDTDGAFLSRCSLPQNSHAITGSDFVWSGYWEGYFFTDFMDGSCRLVFWDVSTDTEGNDLQMTPLDTVQRSEPVVEAALYQRAEELSKRFGVDIRIAEQCSLNYTTYDTYTLDDPMFIREGLDKLENALSKYPVGFFSQLCYGYVESIRIELAGSLMTKDGVTNRRDSAGGFAQHMGSYYLVALDGFMMSEGIVYHEFSHVIDKRLAWDALLREDALFSEEAWLALQPEGFEYAMSYVDENQTEIDLGYFVSDYSMTFPTEDRADLMEEAMTGTQWPFEEGSGCRAKMQFYADCIRDCFDTADWPETTTWEQVLQ